MTPEEFQKWIGNTKIEITIGSISQSYGTYNPKKAWKHIKVGREYWFFNTNLNRGPGDCLYYINHNEEIRCTKKTTEIGKIIMDNYKEIKLSES